MSDDGDENFLIDEMQRAIANLAEHETHLTAEEVLRAIDSLLSGVYFLSNVLQVRADTPSVNAKRSKARSVGVKGRKPASRKPPKAKAVQRGNADMHKASDRAISRIQQGIRQANNSGTLPKLEVLPTLAPPSLKDQKRAAMAAAYGGKDDEKVIRLAGKALSS